MTNKKNDCKQFKPYCCMGLVAITEMALNLLLHNMIGKKL